MHQVNPDPYLRADPEVDIMKTDDEGPNGTAFYDEEELGGEDCNISFIYRSIY